MTENLAISTVNTETPTIHALLAEAIRIATPSWIDEHCEAQELLENLRFSTVAATPDHSLSYRIALCAADDWKETGSQVGLFVALKGPGGQALGVRHGWRKPRWNRTKSSIQRPTLQHLAELAAELMTEITDVGHVRQTLMWRREEIDRALALLPD